MFQTHRIIFLSSLRKIFTKKNNQVSYYNINNISNNSLLILPKTFTMKTNQVNCIHQNHSTSAKVLFVWEMQKVWMEKYRTSWEELAREREGNVELTRGKSKLRFELTVFLAYSVCDGDLYRWTKLCASLSKWNVTTICQHQFIVLKLYMICSK